MKRAFALAVFLVSSSARADDLPAHELNEEARAQYKAGTDALADKRFVEAALHFETAASRTPHAVSWFMAAKAWDQASRPERAADDLSRALDMPGLDASLSEQIRSRLKRTESLVGTVVVTGKSGYRVSLDQGAPVPVPARLHGLPGRHVVHVTPSDHAGYQREVLLTSAQETPFVATEGEEEKKPEPTVQVVEKRIEVEKPGEVRRYVGFGVIGLGVASLASAAVLGISTLDGRDAYRETRTQADYDHVKSLQTWTNVAWISGAVLVAGGAALVLWPTSSTTQVSAGLGHIRVEGRF